MIGQAGDLPLVDRAALPREVRDGTPEEQRSYRAALGFERVLLGELLRPLAESGSGDEEGAGADAGLRRDLVPQALGDALLAAGGVGLAPELHRAMEMTRR